MFEKVISFIEKNIGAVIVFGIITFALVAYGFAAGWFNETLSNMNTSRNKANNMRYSTYENSTVTGMEVLNAIKYNASPTCAITVTTVDSSTGSTNSPKSYTAATGTNGYDNSLVPADTNYIEPTGVFTSLVVYNKKGSVTGITFVQQPKS